MKDIKDLKREKTLPAILEALLFIAVTPVSISQLSSSLDESEKKIKEALEELDKYYTESRGLKLQWHGKKVQLTSSPEFSKIIEDFLEVEVTTTLSQASLEALAIIAYKQPVTRPEIDEIRGVNSDGVVRNLLSKGLIEENGRVEGAGRPILYGTTSDFLNYFGLSSIEELPSFDVLPTNDAKVKPILKD
ncbi:MAG: SMC-Scp complex subunit ScpB [Anaerolineaceae bacterium]|nr:SMC-Scp complex subunit ScpB [Anaerolineaceae bacterium]